MNLLIIPLILLLLIILIYIFVQTILYNTRVNISYPRDNINIERSSSITHNKIGLKGDMGNQFFQLACLISIGKKFDINIVLPTRVLELQINNLVNLSRYNIEDIQIDKTIYEYDNYENIIIENNGTNYNISGYRQSYEYFDDYSDSIRQILKPRNELIDKVKSIIKYDYIAIHIRRGDYIKLIHSISIFKEFSQCSIQYFRHGIKKLREKLGNLPIIICTDDKKWVTDNIIVSLNSENKVIVSPDIDEMNGKLSDFCIMYCAKGLIISNSTYSWWAAYLNGTENVICPSPWWDPKGFIGSSMGLDGPYLHYYKWWILNNATGNVERAPYSKIGEKNNNDSETLDIYRVIRGFVTK